MSEQQALLYEQVGKVVKLTINRPEKRNAMNHAVMQGLHSAFDRIAADDSVSVVVIGGAGEKAFTAGFDLKEAAGSNITDVMERRKDTRGENALWLKMWNLRKPILTMILLASTMLKRDLAAGSKYTLDYLDIGHMNHEQLQKYLREGVFTAK